MPQEQYHHWAAEDEVRLTDRRNTIRDDLTRRLRHVCAHFSEKDFSDLVDAMADRKLKAERRGSG